jgi:ABC-2 type transport system ATP-binding protein
MSAPLIAVRRVSKAFRVPEVQRHTIRELVLSAFRPVRHRTLHVLRDLSLEVERGETVGIMGRNGCGKSTLLRIMCGVYQSDAGVVETKAPITAILELGAGWNPELDAVDNVLVVGTLMGLTIRQVRARMDEILSFAELEPFANVKLKHFSSGMAARLGYALAFNAVREVLLLDEIFAVGDAGFRAKCEARYLELKHRGHTIVLVSHDPRVIGTFCDRAVLLEDGRVADAGEPAAVAARYVDRLVPDAATS